MHHINPRKVKFMELQRLYSYTRKAIDDYNMIEEGDKIAIGISGGKDSITLLYALSGLRRFYPKKFDIIALTVSLGSGNMDFTPIVKLCEELNVYYEIIDTEIYDIVFNVRKEENPCSLCAKMRKGALNTRAKELGCNKIAFAHHRDDMVETLFMSLLFEGRLHSFSPVSYLEKMDLTLIRPMMYIAETEVKGFQNKYNIPVVKNTCPADGFTKREYIKNLIRQLQGENPGMKERAFSAIINADFKDWPKKNENHRNSIIRKNE